MSNNRTLIQQLGFQDKDRLLPRHDAACRYLCEKADSVFALLNRDNQERKFKESRLYTAFTEVALTKRGVRGNSLSIAGFVDAVLEFYCTWTHGGEELHGIRSYVFEVKIHRIPIGDIIRQMKFYREQLELCDIRECHLAWPIQWTAVLDFDITNSELSQLNREDINAIRLGIGFEEFAEAENGDDTNKVPVL